MAIFATKERIKWATGWGLSTCQVSTTNSYPYDWVDSNHNIRIRCIFAQSPDKILQILEAWVLLHCFILANVKSVSTASMTQWFDLGCFCHRAKHLAPVMIWLDRQYGTIVSSYWMTFGPRLWLADVAQKTDCGKELQQPCQQRCISKDVFKRWS